MSKAKIYTRFGDQGKTRLVDGSTVDKHSARVDAYGSVDELNSTLGLAVSFLRKSTKDFAGPDSQKLVLNFEKIQNHLFRVGSLLACSEVTVSQSLPPIEGSHIQYLEKLIDELSESLPELKNFILPGGHEVASQLHICRTVCRRSERIVSLLASEDKSHLNCLIYLNRLSDLLFVAARWANHKTNQPEPHWDKNT